VEKMATAERDGIMLDEKTGMKQYFLKKFHFLTYFAKIMTLT